MAPRASACEHCGRSPRKSSSSPKRKRDTKSEEGAQDSDYASETPVRPRKVARKASATKPKRVAKKDASKDAEKLYANALKVIDKRIVTLDKKVKALGGNTRAIAILDYAISAEKHLPTVDTLRTTDNTLAFNLLLYMADASATDMSATCKMSGEEHDCTPTFELLDASLLSLMELREKPANIGAGYTEVRKRWQWSDADVGDFLTGRPNKQQHAVMYRQKLAWEKIRRGDRRERRETAEDWASVALGDLVEERDYLEQYGIGRYFPKSIARLEELVKGSQPV
ncbi:hypothetical protein G7046_g3101 [Stylonectria norvegica]|nr:hypothetical protein G7046_g3101 [Stylonectria norvegica]